MDTCMGCGFEGPSRWFEYMHLRWPNGSVARGPVCSRCKKQAEADGFVRPWEERNEYDTVAAS